MDNNNRLNRAAEDAKIEICHQIDAFIETMNSRTSDPDSFITMSEIEKEWFFLRSSTTKMYSDIVSAYLTNINEKELIKRKKENMTERGLSSEHINE